MKTMALIGIMVNFLIINTGQAESYDCYHFDTSLTIEISESSAVSAQLWGYKDDHAHTTTLLETFVGKVLNPEQVQHTLFGHKEIELTDSQGLEASLKIVHSPNIGRGGLGRGGCGRGSCDFNNIKGIWSYQNETVKLECYETF